MKKPNFEGTSIRDWLKKHGIDDPRLLGLALIAFVGLSVIWSGVGIVQRNYELQQKATLLEEENRVLELQNSNKRLQNNYYETPEFAELKARSVNGVAAPGEEVYIISDEVALSALQTQEESTQPVVSSVEVDKPFYQENFEAWIDFFFGS